MKRLFSLIAVGLALLLTIGMHAPPVSASKDHVAVVTDVTLDNFSSFSMTQDLVSAQPTSEHRQLSLNVDRDAVALLDSRMVETSYRPAGEVSLSYYNFIENATTNTGLGVNDSKPLATASLL